LLKNVISIIKITDYFVIAYNFFLNYFVKKVFFEDENHNDLINKDF